MLTLFACGVVLVQLWGMLVNENARDTEDREDLPSFRNCDVSPWVELDRVPSTRKKIGSFLKAPRTIC